MFTLQNLFRLCSQCYKDRHIKTIHSARKKSCSGLKYLLWMPQTQLEMSRGLLKKMLILTSLGSHSRLEATAFDELGMRLKSTILEIGPLNR